jgi:hypothetical protein
MSLFAARFCASLLVAALAGFARVAAADPRG